MKFTEQLSKQVEELRELIKEQNELYKHFETRESKILNKWCSNHIGKRQNKSNY